MKKVEDEKIVLRGHNRRFALKYEIGSDVEPIILLRMMSVLEAKGSLANDSLRKRYRDNFLIFTLEGFTHLSELLTLIKDYLVLGDDIRKIIAKPDPKAKVSIESNRKIENEKLYIRY